MGEDRTHGELRPGVETVCEQAVSVYCARATRGVDVVLSVWSEEQIRLPESTWLAPPHCLGSPLLKTSPETLAHLWDGRGAAQPAGLTETAPEDTDREALGLPLPAASGSSAWWPGCAGQESGDWPAPQAQGGEPRGRRALDQVGTEPPAPPSWAWPGRLPGPR